MHTWRGNYCQNIDNCPCDPLTWFPKVPSLCDLFILLIVPVYDSMGLDLYPSCTCPDNEWGVLLHAPHRSVDFPNRLYWRIKEAERLEAAEV